ncbi:MAG: hypothetical protein Roseis2KO_60640 [Roseivirga sp.]
MKRNWKYIATEILIVIIGIMIAFSINNFSANYKDRKALAENLTSIENDLAADLKSIDDIIVRQNEKIRDFQTIKELLRQKEPDWMQVSTLISKQQSSPTFYPITSTFQSTVSSGKIDLIKDLGTKKNLFHLYEFTYKKAVYNGQLYDQSHIDYFDKRLINYVDFDSNLIIDRQGIKSQETLNSLSYLIDEARGYIKLLEKVREDNRNLNTVIEKL